MDGSKTCGGMFVSCGAAARCAEWVICTDLLVGFKSKKEAMKCGIDECIFSMKKDWISRLRTASDEAAAAAAAISLLSVVGDGSIG